MALQINKRLRFRLRKKRYVINIKEEVNYNLDVAIHQIVFKNHRKAVLFENIKGSRFSAVFNLFATLEQRIEYLSQYSKSSKRL